MNKKLNENTLSAREKIPSLIYGTAWKKDSTAELVELAVKCGFRGIDTACQPRHYREDLAGEGLKRCLNGRNGFKIDRSDLFIQTKFTPPGGQDEDTIPYDPSAPVEEQVMTSFEISRKNLNVEIIDSLILHSPIEPYEETMKAWKAMEDILTRGEVRFIGLSNCYDLSLFKNVCSDSKVKPAFIQNRFYRDTGYDRELRGYCRENDIIYQGFWTLTANPHILESDALRAISSKYEMTSPQIYYRYLTQRGIIPLIGSKSEEHLLQDLEIFSFNLNEDELISLDGLFSGAV